MVPFNESPPSPFVHFKFRALKHEMKSTGAALHETRCKIKLLIINLSFNNIESTQQVAHRNMLINEKITRTQ